MHVQAKVSLQISPSIDSHSIITIIIITIITIISVCICMYRTMCAHVDAEDGLRHPSFSTPSSFLSVFFRQDLVLS